MQPLPSIPSNMTGSAMGSDQSMMYGDQPQGADDSQGGMPPTADAQQDSKKSSFLSQHKELMSTLQTMAQAYPEFAPFTGKMMDIAKTGLVQAIGAMSKTQKAERPSGGFLS